jgi:hypothetical protein
MNDDVRPVPPEEGDTDEAWERLTDEPDVRGVDAAWIAAADGWQVSVWVLEFVRADPLGAELRQRVASALAAVDGVTEVAEYDRESWFVTGRPSGKALTEAAAQVADDLADRTRAYAG